MVTFSLGFFLYTNVGRREVTPPRNMEHDRNNVDENGTYNRPTWEIFLIKYTCVYVFVASAPHLGRVARRKLKISIIMIWRVVFPSLAAARRRRL